MGKLSMKGNYYSQKNSMRWPSNEASAQNTDKTVDQGDTFLTPQWTNDPSLQTSSNKFHSSNKIPFHTSKNVASFNLPSHPQHRNSIPALGIHDQFSNISENNGAGGFSENISGGFSTGGVNSSPTTDDAIKNKKYQAKEVQLVSWSHAHTISEEDVMVDITLLPKDTKEGDIAELRSPENGLRFYFIVKPLNEELMKITPPVQVSHFFLSIFIYFFELAILTHSFRFLSKKNLKKFLIFHHAQKY